MEKELDRLDNKYWLTKGARFIAAKRFEWLGILSIWTMSLISIYVISLNLIILFPFGKKMFSEDIISFATICFSILILVMSNIISLRNYDLTANKFHDCAREISIVYDELCKLRTVEGGVKEYQINQLNGKYHEILKKYDFNHSNLDHLLYKVQNLESKEFSMGFKSKIYVKYFLNYYLIYVVLILLPLFFLLNDWSE